MKKRIDKELTRPMDRLVKMVRETLERCNSAIDEFEKQDREIEKDVIFAQKLFYTYHLMIKKLFELADLNIACFKKMYPYIKKRMSPSLFNENTIQKVLDANLIFIEGDEYAIKTLKEMRHLVDDEKNMLGIIKFAMEDIPEFLDIIKNGSKMIDDMLVFLDNSKQSLTGFQYLDAMDTITIKHANQILDLANLKLRDYNDFYQTLFASEEWQKHWERETVSWVNNELEQI